MNVFNLRSLRWRLWPIFADIATIAACAYFGFTHFACLWAGSMIGVHMTRANVRLELSRIFRAKYMEIFKGTERA